MAERASEAGWVAPQLAEELPGLALRHVSVEACAGSSPQSVRRQLKALASRITGAKVVHSRQDSVPWAYRVLWRRLGLDPDTDRTPVEQLMVERLEHGGIPSHGMPNDAVVMATLETGIPIVVFDADQVQGTIGLRPTEHGETLKDERDVALRSGEIVYADESQPVARLVGEVASACGVGDGTTKMLICALTTTGVPDMAVEEALWMVVDLLEGAGRLDTSS
jgi:DNA/RNA-binding domain of Phe-tRNA-synthetase-like protein